MSSPRSRRVRALEQAIGIVSLEEQIESDIQAMWSLIEERALAIDVSAEELAEGVRSGMRRKAEIGDVAYIRESAAELGITEAETRDPDVLQRINEQMDQEWQEWEARRAAEMAKVEYWRAGVRYVGGVPADGRNSA